MVWFGVVKYDMVWCGAVRCGAVRCGVVRCVWCAVKRVALACGVWTVIVIQIRS